MVNTGFTVFVQSPKTARFHRVSNALPSSMPCLCEVPVFLGKPKTRNICCVLLCLEARSHSHSP